MEFHIKDEHLRNFNKYWPTTLREYLQGVLDKKYKNMNVTSLRTEFDWGKFSEVLENRVIKNLTVEGSNPEILINWENNIEKKIDRYTDKIIFGLLGKDVYHVYSGYHAMQLIDGTDCKKCGNSPFLYGPGDYTEEGYIVKSKRCDNDELCPKIVSSIVTFDIYNVKSEDDIITEEAADVLNQTLLDIKKRKRRLIHPKSFKSF
jgi:hypothetical protein